jgi:hypothetical protein
MKATEYLIWLTGMALAIITVVVVGTLAAAGLLHRPRRHNRSKARSETSDRKRPANDVQAARAQESDAPSDREPDVSRPLAPLGSSLTPGSRLSAPSAAETGKDRHHPGDQAA